MLLCKSASSFANICQCEKCAKRAEEDKTAGLLCMHYATPGMLECMCDQCLAGTISYRDAVRSTNKMIVRFSFPSYRTILIASTIPLAISGFLVWYASSTAIAILCMWLIWLDRLLREYALERIWEWLAVSNYVDRDHP